MQQTKTAPPAAGTGNGIAGKLPMLDCATQTCIIRSGNAIYLIREKANTSEVVGVVGRWIRGSKDKGSLRPDAEKDEFIHNHESGYHYLLAKVDAATAEAVIAERKLRQ
ncbi:MAG: hypothetical protein PHV13_05670 [Candidatus ainarchaeum sp.]|nr:hypothetical protein [Candidatus ainarchaeum sp.]